MPIVSLRDACHPQPPNELLAALSEQLAVAGGPSSLLDVGLPEGFVARLETRVYGDALTVHFASRLDQIHFKLYAVIDQGPGKHESDLRALNPTPDELVRAARWTRTHDPSPGFKCLVEQTLSRLGIADADLGA